MGKDERDDDRELQGGAHDHAPPDPTEEAGPERCNPSAEEVGFSAGDLDGAVNDSQHRVQDELDDACRFEPIVMMPSPEDGMPIPADESVVRYAPPFSYDTVVCIGDERAFVALYDDEVADAVGPGWQVAVEWAAPGVATAPATVTLGLRRPHATRAVLVVQPSRFSESGEETHRSRFQPDAVRNRFGLRMALLGTGWALVRPIREPCKFYKTQVFGNEDEPDPTRLGARIPQANCTARRSVGGAFLSLRDEAVYACEYRSPPDRATEEKYIHAWNRERLESRRHLDMVPLFNLRDVRDVSQMPHVSPGPYTPPKEPS